MVVQTEKGLGPGAIEPKEYFRFAKKDHLRDSQAYQRLTLAAAAYCDTSMQKLLEKWIKTYLDVLSKEERKKSHEPEVEQGAMGLLVSPFQGT